MSKTSIRSSSGNVPNKVSPLSLSLPKFHLKLICDALGYYDVDVGLPDTQAGLRVMSIQDLNNDKMNDMITIDDAAQKVTIFYFSESSLKYD